MLRYFDEKLSSFFSIKISWLGKTLSEDLYENLNFTVIKKSASRNREAEQNIEFSHVNGPKRPSRWLSSQPAFCFIKLMNIYFLK